MECWSFKEYQAYAKGFFEGIWFTIIVIVMLTVAGTLGYVWFSK